MSFVDASSSALDPLLSEEHLEVRKMVREFAREEVAPLAAALDEEKRVPHETVAKLADLGLLGVPWPEEMGGAGMDYLAYAIIDAVIDGYYPILEALGDHLEALEDEIVSTPNPSALQEIHRLKRELLNLRRSVWPQREAVNQLIRDESEFVSDTVRVYLRDCYDHAVQIMDVIETYRELTGGLMDVYLSSVANRQNEVMKVLTIMASIFIPLTFLAGLYGMNFDHMPELHFAWAYPLLLFVMMILALLMVGFFRRKGWLGGHRPMIERSRDQST